MTEDELTEFKRRLGDKFADQSDHDLLIMHTVRIDTICDMIKGLGKELNSYTEKIDTRCEHRTGEMYQKIGEASHDSVSDNTFRWIIGIMILIMISMVTIIGVNQVAISNNTQRVSTVVRDIRDLEKELHELELEKKELKQQVERLHFKNYSN